MNPNLQELLKRLSAHYIWWKSPDEAMRHPRRIITQVMNIGDFEDMQQLAEILGDKALRGVLRDAEAGEFNERSWHYWHYRLGMSKLDQVPDLPKRCLP
jgi:hypothetical protein